MARAVQNLSTLDAKTKVNYIDFVFGGLLGGLIERIFMSHQYSARVPEFHTHPGEQVVVGLTGRGHVEVLRHAGTDRESALTYAFGEGDVTVLPPDKPHRWITPQGELIAVAINLGPAKGSPREQEELARDLQVVTASLLGTGAHEVYPELVKDDAAFAKLVEQFRHEALVRRPGLRVRVGALALDMLVHLARCCVTAGARRDGDGRPAEVLPRLAPRHYVERTRVLMHANYRRPWTLNDFAEEAGLSITHLHRLFVQELGEPPMTYLRHYRLRRAAEMLANTAEPVAAVAERVGFSSPERFSKAFRQYFDRSPRAHRKQALAEGGTRL